MADTNSRYSNTPTTDFYLDIWEPITIAESADDKEIVIADSHHERPDLLSHVLYGTTKLWWVFACRNMDILVDPIADFKAGTLIYAPAPKTVESLQ